MQRPLVILLLFILSFQFCQAQNVDITKEELSDLTEKAMQKFSTFTDYVALVASGEESSKVRKMAKQIAIDCFTSDGIVQEISGKRSKVKRSYHISEYMDEIVKRSQKPRFIDFYVTKPINPDDLVPIDNGDGTTTYEGKIEFEQFYCTLKNSSEVVLKGETPQKAAEEKCSYFDTTTKEVDVEFRSVESTMGRYWVVYISIVRATAIR
jgi:hypothetical protein